MAKLSRKSEQPWTCEECTREFPNHAVPGAIWNGQKICADCYRSWDGAEPGGLNDNDDGYPEPEAEE